MDLLLGNYSARYLNDLAGDGISALEALLDASDHDVLSWISGEVETPPEYDTPVLDALKTMRLTPDDYN